MGLLIFPFCLLKKTLMDVVKDFGGSVRDVYVDHLLSGFSHLVSFYREILGEETASLRVLDAGELGVLFVEGFCALVSLIAVEFFLAYSLFIVSSTLLKSKRFLILVSSYFFFIFGCFLCCTANTREAFVNKYVNVPTHWLPDLVEKDLVSLSSFEELFLLIGQASVLTWETSKLWAVCLLVMLGPIARVVIYTFVGVSPLLKLAVEEGVKAFLGQDITNIVLEISTVLFVILSWLLKRHIERARYFPRHSLTHSLTLYSSPFSPVKE
jgi:hypothetical protein